MTHFSYARVSTTSQDTEQQTKVLKEAYKIDISFEDKASGKNLYRMNLDAMLTVLKEGDSVFCYDVSRIGRNTQDVLNLVELLKNKGVKLIIKSLDGMDITSPTGKLILTVMASVATMERETMLEKQALGIEKAKLLGKYQGKKANPKTAVKCAAVLESVNNGLKVPEALRAHEVSRATYYLWKSQQ